MGYKRLKWAAGCVIGQSGETWRKVKKYEILLKNM